MLIKQGYVDPEIENTPEGFYQQYKQDQAHVDAVNDHLDTVKSAQDSHLNDAEAWAKENGDELYDEASGEYQKQAEQKVRMALESGDYKTAQRELDWLRDHKNQINSRDEKIQAKEKEAAEIERLTGELKRVLDERWEEAKKQLDQFRFGNPMYRGDLLTQLKIYDRERFESEGLQKDADMAVRNFEQFFKSGHRFGPMAADRRDFFGPMIPRFYVLGLVKALKPEMVDDFRSNLRPGELEKEVQELMLDLEGGHPRQALTALMDIRSLKKVDVLKYEQIVNNPRVKTELEHLAKYCSNNSRVGSPFMAKVLKELVPSFDYDQVENLKDFLFLAKDGRDLTAAYGAANIVFDKD